MKFKLIVLIQSELKIIFKKKKFIKLFFVKPKFITLVPVKNDFSLINTIKINNFLKTFFDKKIIKYFIKNNNKFFKNNLTYKFYFNILKRTYIYNLLKFDKLKSNLYSWTKRDVKFLNLFFPFNSRYKFSYQRNADNVFMTLSAGMLSKIFNSKKKSLRQSKKIFKLGLLFFKRLIKLNKKYLLVLILKSIHKNLFFFLKLIIKNFDLNNKTYICYFNYKKFTNLLYFKKKRSIKKKIQKRLALQNKKI